MIGKDLFVLEMATLPTVPYGDIMPIVPPLQLEQVETTIFKDLHATVFHSDLHIGSTRPIPQHLGGIGSPHDDDVQGLATTILGNGHSMQAGARREIVGRRSASDHLVKVIT